MVACLKQLSKTMLLDILSPTLVALSGNNYLIYPQQWLHHLGWLSVWNNYIFPFPACSYLLLDQLDQPTTMVALMQRSRFHPSLAFSRLLETIWPDLSTYSNPLCSISTSVFWHLKQYLHFQFNLWSQEVPEDSFCFENISIWLSVFSIRCITLPNHLVAHTTTLHQSFALWFILLWSPIVWRK